LGDCNSNSINSIITSSIELGERSPYCDRLNAALIVRAC